jgi:hypothetical protein
MLLISISYEGGGQRGVKEWFNLAGKYDCMLHIIDMHADLLTCTPAYEW